MQFSNHTRGKVIKSQVYNFGTVANGATPNSGNIASLGDDNKARKLIAIYSTEHTALARTIVNYSGKPVLIIDDNVFSSAAGVLDLEITYPIGVYFELAMTNGTGGNVTNEVTLFYEVDAV